jgi:aminoglycoside 3-N-acetyltransferase
MVEIKPHQTPTLTREEIVVGLRKLGIAGGDVLGVHSSLSSLGTVEGGAETVLEALFEAVGTLGTLVMSTYLVGPPLELTPEDLQCGITWKVKRIPFDDLSTPSGMGVISDAFRRHPQVVRWHHPIHSVSAWGKDAGRFCQGFKPLVQAGGKILLLGVLMDRCSALHIAEEMVRLPEEVCKLMRWEVPVELLRVYPPDQWVIGCQGAWGDFLIVQAEAVRRGMIRTSQIGAATARLFDAQPMVELYAELLKQDPYRMFGTSQVR